MTPSNIMPDVTHNHQKIETLAHDMGLVDREALHCFPKYIQLETASNCNGRCSMCPVAELQREHRYMTPTLFDKISGELGAFSGWINQVIVQGHGEPLMDKELETRIATLKRLGIKRVSFATNGTMMTSDRAQSILASGVDEVDFSIDGVSKETYETIRHPLKFKQCLNNVKGFLELRNRLKPALRVRIRITLQESNIHEFSDFCAFWSSLLAPGDDVYGKHLHHWGNWLPHYALPPKQNREQLNVMPCPSPWTSMILFSDGRVPLCCEDFNAVHSLGDVSTHSIQSVWQNSISSHVRQLHLQQGRRGMSLCVDCNVWDPSSRVKAPQ